MNIVVKRQFFIPSLLIPLSLLLSLSLLFTGCTTKLAPPYDQVVANELTNLSPDLMTLMASISNGVGKDSFATREATYNSLIGRLDALAIQAGARPMPKNKVTDEINRLLKKRNDTAGLEDDDTTPPSTHAIKKISETLSKARDTDRKQGLTAYEAIAFKGQIVIYLDQAVTYENFLQR